MALTTRCLLTFVMLMFFEHFGLSQSSYSNQEDWVDPDDLMNYDRVSKTMIKPENTRSRANDWVDPNEPECPLKCCNEHRNEVSNFQVRLSKCEDKIVTLLGSHQTCPDTGKESFPSRNTQPNPVKAVETMYMKRFVNILLRVSGLNKATINPEDDALVKTLLIAVKREQLVALRRFGEDDKMTLAELDNILSVVLQSSESGFTIPVPVEWIDYWKHFFSSEEIFLHMTTWAIILVPLLMIGLQRKYSEIISTFLCLILVFGFQWKYNFMVKMAEVEQQLAVQNGPPPECRPDLMTWTQSLLHALVGDPDSCRQYHRSQMVAPALSVTPTLVLAHLLADTLARPMEAMGQGIGRFSSGVLDSLSWYMGPFVLAFVLTLLAVMVVLLAGGSVGNMLFSLTGRRRSDGPRRIAVEPVASLPWVANLPTPNTPTVVHHIHHHGRGLAPSDAPMLAPPDLGDRRLAPSPPTIQSDEIVGSWIKDAIASGVGVGTPDRESLEESTSNISRIEYTPTENSRRKRDASGDHLRTTPKSLYGSALSADRTGRGKDKRFLKRDLKSSSREAVVLREIHSLLNDALQRSEVDEESDRKRVVLVSLESESVTGQPDEAETIEGEVNVSREGDSPSTSHSFTQPSPDLRSNHRTSDGSGSDFSSLIADVFEKESFSEIASVNESFSESVSGNDSSVVESEFVTSIRNALASDNEEAS